jgi:multiple sugar transport system permease protein
MVKAGKKEYVFGQKLTFKEKIERDFSYNWMTAKKYKMLYLFIAPYIILFTTFTILPIAISIVFSFTNFNILEPPQWVGITNYYRLFVSDDIFVRAIGITFMFAAIIGPGGFFLSLTMAWLINELPRALRVIFTVLLFAPSLAGGMTRLFVMFFSPDANGWLNAILISNGFNDEPVRWLLREESLVPIIIGVGLWGSLGTSFLAFIAGLQGVDRQYYEAGAIDGIKNRWQELWFITLPLMKPQLFFGAVMSITGSFQIANLITQLGGNPTVNYCAHTIMQHLQDFGNIRFEMGYASAIATLLFLLMLGMNKAVRRLINRVGE